MRYFLFGLAFLLSQSSCSSFSIPKTDSLISLRDVQQIKLGQDSKLELERNFGKASEGRSLDSEYEVVYYDRPLPGKDYLAQRASFVLLKRSQIVVSALWIPFGPKETQTVDEAKEYFSSANFTFRKHLREVSHEGALEYSLDDQISGISIDIGISSQKVTSIGFGIPSARAISSTKQ